MGSLKGGPLSHRRDCRMVEESVDESRVLAAHAGAALQLWMELNAAEAAVAAFGPTPEQLREETAEAERLAKESGTPAKSAKVIGVCCSVGGVTSWTCTARRMALRRRKGRRLSWRFTFRCAGFEPCLCSGGLLCGEGLCCTVPVELLRPGRRGCGNARRVSKK